MGGVVVKRADSPYRSGRTNNWQKFKIRYPESVWVTAWLPGDPGELDRYWVGRPVDGMLVPSGEVSYGLTPDQPRRFAVSCTVAGHGRQSVGCATR